MAGWSRSHSHAEQASIVGSVVEWPPATRSARVQFPDDASQIFFNPSIHPCVLGDKEIQIRSFAEQPAHSLLLVSKMYGGAGYRSRYLSHAKRALYHLSYAPCWGQMANWFVFKTSFQSLFLLSLTFKATLSSKNPEMHISFVKLLFLSHNSYH